MPVYAHVWWVEARGQVRCHLHLPLCLRQDFLLSAPVYVRLAGLLASRDSLVFIAHFTTGVWDHRCVLPCWALWVLEIWTQLLILCWWSRLPRSLSFLKLIVQRSLSIPKELLLSITSYIDQQLTHISNFAPLCSLILYTFSNLYSTRKWK